MPTQWFLRRLAFYLSFVLIGLGLGTVLIFLVSVRVMNSLSPILLAFAIGAFTIALLDRRTSTTVQIEEAITIHANLAKVYALDVDLDNLPKVNSKVKSARVVSEGANERTIAIEEKSGFTYTETQTFSKDRTEHHDHAEIRDSKINETWSYENVPDGTQLKITLEVTSRGHRLFKSRSMRNLHGQVRDALEALRSLAET